MSDPHERPTATACSPCSLLPLANPSLARGHKAAKPGATLNDYSGALFY